MLACFAAAVKKNMVISALDYDDEQLARIADDLSQPAIEKSDMLDRWLTRLLFEWAHNSAGQAALEDVVAPLTITKLSELFEAADLSKPASVFSITRSSHPRKIVMHVGPTNSGKTHNALRALAAARTGAYAGPLRLLAHEIWERLNKGQIIPAGAEVNKEEVDEDPSSTFDVGSQPVIRKSGDGRYARACNLVTGDEQKIVDEHATLLSCTVEMIPTSQRYDVAVIDEIQLLGDTERGGAWLRALLGVNAAEVHLCGEETAVPLVQRLLQDTGDEVVVNRYQRLTPLRVETESLHGDLSKVKKGDCVVAFSRKQIFALKQRIEESTGMQCAVAYGRLPPEIRSEQAALFNQQGSGYDVLVGSDAIGMGLNLKIKRIVLEAASKWDGVRRRPLSISQIKQISGRAGRYGLHGDENLGGFVTTLHQTDLADVRRAIAAPITHLKQARISPLGHVFEAVATALPQDAAAITIVDVLYYAAKLPPTCELEDVRKLRFRLDFLGDLQADLTMNDQVLLQLAPVPVSDVAAQTAFRALSRMYCDDFHVGLKDVLREADLLEDFESAVRAVTENDSAADQQNALQTLESVHKIIVVYLWLSYRAPVAFIEQDEAFKLRDIAEQSMQKCLELLSAVKGKVSRPKRLVRGDAVKYKPGSTVRDEALQKRAERLEHGNSLRDPYGLKPASRDGRK
ncbi:P-loop containing nucleoside triphosphate hydrolase protein [Fomitopsis serialis]|uniref:P-loop containing nucleoside triphosphate hydrolase protein n=1 Tax=Fomitopsis serialis TaxID=139415 RepID=UPI002007232E|nr:P-loop containing nucleoside triphosphate hydrolase protein [Neoantrodia serialis]KAH9930848.1 P-loop containing nucleoside triphosphate hydrolase protein [Neoantrodia serialis]